MQLLKCFIDSWASLLKVLIVMVVLDMLSSLLSRVAISASVCRDQSIELYMDFFPSRPTENDAMLRCDLLSWYFSSSLFPQTLKSICPIALDVDVYEIRLCFLLR
jgi:hypothetical protein